jgi:hypothetical protein
MKVSEINNLYQAITTLHHINLHLYTSVIVITVHSSTASTPSPYL